MKLLFALVVMLGLLGSTIAHAGDAVALLPLDADKSLEIYGQPVASEIARALVAGSVDVVVVGPKAGVPDRVRIVVDGRVAGDKNDTVVLTIRVRDRFDGTVLDTLSATSPLANIDRAASELSARLLPSVKAILDKLHRAPEPKPNVVKQLPPEPPKARPVLVSIIAYPPFKQPLTDAIATWTVDHHRTQQVVDPNALGPSTSVESIAKAGAELGIAFEVDRYLLEPSMVDAARARVRVRISTPAGVAFDRVVITDLVVGDKKITEEQMAARVAREVLAIVAPHLKKAVPAW